MDVLVAGGTGYIGTELCRTLAGRGHAVTALARDPSDASLPEEVTQLAADVTEEASVTDAVAGHDAVVNLVSLSPLYQPPTGTSHDAVHRGGTETLVESAAEAGVRRFVQMSGLGADPDGPTAFLRAKGRAESIVRTSPLEWVIARPSVVVGGGSEFVRFVTQVTTPYVTGLPGGGKTMRFQPIWRGDLVELLADCVDVERHAGETYELGGPEVLTLAEVTRIVWDVAGKSVRILPVPMALAKVGLTLADPLPFVPLGRDQARVLTFDNVVSTNDVVRFDRDLEELRPFRSAIADEFA